MRNLKYVSRKRPPKGNGCFAPNIFGVIHAVCGIITLVLQAVVLSAPITVLNVNIGLLPECSTLESALIMVASTAQIYNSLVSMPIIHTKVI